jgi:hypothetical protein
VVGGLQGAERRPRPPSEAFWEPGRLWQYPAVPVPLSAGNSLTDITRIYYGDATERPVTSARPGYSVTGLKCATLFMTHLVEWPCYCGGQTCGTVLLKYLCVTRG